MMQNAAFEQKEHTIALSNRKILSLTGISDVISFDETLVTLSCSQSIMSIEGEGMRVLRMDVDLGDLAIEGKINAISYIDKRTRKSGLFSKK